MQEYELIDELKEDKAVQELYQQIDITLSRTQRLYDYLDSLKQIAGEGAVIQYKEKNSDEWLTY